MRGYTTLQRVAVAILLLGLIVTSAFIGSSSQHRSLLTRSPEPASLSVIEASFNGSSSDDLSLNDLLYDDSSSNSSAHISPRALDDPIAPASSEVFARATIKGQHLICWMESPASAGDQRTSRWTSIDEIEDWGWTSAGGQIQFTRAPPAEDICLVPTFATAPPGELVNLKHTKRHAPVVQGGVSYNYPATNAIYRNSYNVDTGAIVAVSNAGPQWKIDISKPSSWNDQSDRIPQLHHLSDVWWLTWSYMCFTRGKDPGTLKYIVRNEVVNRQTKAVLASVLQANWGNDPDCREGRAPAWPGKMITRTTPGFAALLGTPNVWGIPYMLIQRGNSGLGKKRVKSIHAYTPNSHIMTYAPVLLVELENI